VELFALGHRLLRPLVLSFWVFSPAVFYCGKVPEHLFTLICVGKVPPQIDGMVGMLTFSKTPTISPS
jgi:hypothetical protein